MSGTGDSESPKRRPEEIRNVKQAGFALPNKEPWRRERNWKQRKPEKATRGNTECETGRICSAEQGAVEGASGTGIEVKIENFQSGDLCYAQSLQALERSMVLNMENAIEIKGLTKFYGKHRGVADINLEVRWGDIFGFLGPNGAGKSTTIRSMLGLLRFQKGEIRLLGMNAAKQRKEALRRIGYMPSEAMFYPGMKVKDVIAFAAKARKMDCSREAERISSLLEVDGEKKIEELSLGNRKKVSIVCAMQHKPEILILDEPTSGLDPLMQEAFFKLLLEYNSWGTTCFLSSHVLSEVKSYCRNAAIVKEGALIRVDTVENLSKSNVRHIKLRERGKMEEFVYTGNMKELIGKLSDRELEDVLIEEPPLEEVFMHYYEQPERKDEKKIKVYEEAQNDTFKT